MLLKHMQPLYNPTSTYTAPKALRHLASSPRGTQLPHGRVPARPTGARPASTAVRRPDRGARCQVHLGAADVEDAVTPLGLATHTSCNFCIMMSVYLQVV